MLDGRCTPEIMQDLCCHFTPGFIGGIGSLGLLLPPPAVCMEPPDASLFVWTVLFPVVLTAVQLFPPCRPTAVHLFFVLLVPLC